MLSVSERGEVSSIVISDAVRMRLGRIRTHASVLVGKVVAGLIKKLPDWKCGIDALDVSIDVCTC